mmetsp:Transcript_34831/g.107527  ORF Transcript_34831/g.107527 Transcript_34831/m.107527 type:complete len:205 (-) Transcript_34831:469-1083(-)
MSSERRATMASTRSLFVGSSYTSAPTCSVAEPSDQRTTRALDTTRPLFDFAHWMQLCGVKKSRGVFCGLSAEFLSNGFGARWSTCRFGWTFAISMSHTSSRPGRAALLNGFTGRLHSTTRACSNSPPAIMSCVNQSMAVSPKTSMIGWTSSRRLCSVTTWRRWSSMSTSMCKSRYSSISVIPSPNRSWHTCSTSYSSGSSACVW